MAYGIRIKHPDTGEVLLELTSRITRKVGTASTGAAAGSLTVPTTVEGEVWFVPITFPYVGAFYGTTPSMSLSGRTISWTANCNTTFLYGVF